MSSMKIEKVMKDINKLHFNYRWYIQVWLENI